MATEGFGVSDANFAGANSEHATAFVSWQRAKETENELLKVNARTLRVQQKMPLIVLVDDEPVVAVTLSEILRRKGKMVVWFTESLRALDYFRLGPVDLLLSDITMPEMDGVSLAAQAHAIRPACGLLLFSAVAGEPEVIEQLTTLGMSVQLAFKPLRIPCLLSTIDGLLAGCEQC